MSKSSGKSKCSICEEETNTFMCRGCSKDFCFDHLTEHRRYLSEQLGFIQNDFNQFRQKTIDLKKGNDNHPLIRQIDCWEIDSIRKIKQKAEECRRLVIDYTNKAIDQVEKNLNKTNEEYFSRTKPKKDFSEIDLQELKEKLAELNKQVYQTRTLSMEHKSDPFVGEISIRLKKRTLIPNININQKWKQDATSVIAGGSWRWTGSTRLCHARGIFIDDDQTIYIAERDNHRIVAWKRNSNNGQTVAGGNGHGDQNDQLNAPSNVIIDHENDSLLICDQGNRRVVRWPCQNGQTGEVLLSNISCFDLKLDNDGYLYVSDTEKHEVRRWKIGETNGTIVAGGNGKGDRLDQFDVPSGIFIDDDHSVYVSDEENQRVMKWVQGAKEGIVVAGGHSKGNGLRQLSYPAGIIVDQLGTLYIADLRNARVMRWLKGAEEGTIVVGGNGEGEQLNQLNKPVDLSFDRENNLYVVDFRNHRIQRFEVI